MQANREWIECGACFFSSSSSGMNILALLNKTFDGNEHSTTCYHVKSIKNHPKCLCTPIWFEPLFTDTGTDEMIHHFGV